MAEKIAIRNYLKFNGLQDDQINKVGNWGTSFENRGGVGYATEDDIQNYYAKANGMTWVRGALNNAGVDSGRIGYDFTSNKMTLDGRINDLGETATIGGKMYARPDQVNNLLGPRLTPKVGSGITALQNSMDPEKVKADPLYQAMQQQIAAQTQAANNAAGRSLAARGMLGTGSSVAMKQFQGIQDQSSQALLTQAMPTVMNQVWQKNMGVLDKTMQAENQSQENGRADAAITGSYMGAPTLQAQSAQMANLWPAMTNTGQIPNMDAMMQSNPAYRGILGTLGQYAGQQTQPAREHGDNIAVQQDQTASNERQNSARINSSDQQHAETIGLQRDELAQRKKEFKQDLDYRYDAIDAKDPSAFEAEKPGSYTSSYKITDQTEAAWIQLDKGIKLMMQQNGGKPPSFAEASKYADAMIGKLDPNDAAWFRAKLQQRFGVKGVDFATIMKDYRKDQAPEKRNIYEP